MQLMVSRNLWKISPPAKMCVFSWQLLFDRIPTRYNLFGEGTLGLQNPWIIFCVVVWTVYGGADSSGLQNRYTVNFPLTSGMEYLDGWACPHFSSGFIYIFCDLHNGGEMQEDRAGSISNLTCNNVWKCRLFNNWVIIAKDVVDNIKAWSWCWFLGRGFSTLCMYYEWVWNPLSCMVS